MQKSNINPECLQAMLESATNAADKGQSQFFTPVAFGQLLAAALPKNRPTLVDLTCGAGHLLQASANSTTTALLGSDIDPCRCAAWEPDPADKTQPPHVNKISQDLTLLAPLLTEIKFKADAFVLNPPWHLFWHRERLAHLNQSWNTPVRLAFQAKEDAFHGGCPADCIDSTIATLAVALDLCTIYGEGFLIGNDATLQRLLFQPGAPYAALAKHIWAHLTIPGNPMTGLDDCLWQKDTQFFTGVIYFAADHTLGPKHLTFPLDQADPKFLPKQLADLRQYRMGAEVRNVHVATDAAVPWQTVKEHVAELQGRAPKTPWNLWLNVGGRIRTALSRFEERSTKVDKAEAARLFKLTGRKPMELVLQRAQRDELLHVAEQAGWRVQPELLEAVHAAIRQYHAARAPLYPLPEIQRLGYLDEQDAISCKADLAALGRGVVFQAGHTYPIRTQTVPVTRKVTKPNPQTGEDETLELSGQELAILLKLNGTEYCFMDGRLQSDANTTVPNVKEIAYVKSSSQRSDPKGAGPAIDFSLQELCAHFIIPDVPDVATVNPTGYEQNLQALKQLEALTA